MPIPAEVWKSSEVNLQRMVRRSSSSTYTYLVRVPASGREDARPFLLKCGRAVQVDAPLPRSDFILQPQITIIKIDTPGALEGRPSL
jgi:hypothetical protein